MRRSRDSSRDEGSKRREHKRRDELDQTANDAHGTGIASIGTRGLPACTVRLEIGTEHPEAGAAITVKKLA